MVGSDLFSLIDLSHNLGRLFDGDGPYADAVAKQQKWNDQRDQIYANVRAVKNGLNVGYEPQTVSCDAFDGMSHQQICDSVQEMKPDVIRSAAEAWTNIGIQFDTATGEFHSGIAGRIAQGWRSPQAAGRAVDAVGRFAVESRQLGKSCELLAGKLAEAHSGLDETKALIPPVPAGSKLFGLIPVSGLLKSDHYEKEEATQEARRIMHTVYAPVVAQTDTGVPVLPEAPKVVDNPAPGTGSGGGGVLSGGGFGLLSGGGGGTPGEVTSPVSIDGDAAAEQPQPAAASAGPGAGTHAARTDSASPASGGSGSTAPASAWPGGGYGGGGGGVGSGNGPGVGGVLASPVLPGPGAGKGGSGSGIGRAAAAVARAGTPGMGGVAPRGKGKGEEDKEHKTAEYLRGTDNGEELIADVNGRKVAPSVIGVWDEDGKPKW